MSRDSLRTNKDIVEKVEQLLQAVYEEKKEFNEVLNGIDPIEIPSLNPGQDDHRLEISDEAIKALSWACRERSTRSPPTSPAPAPAAAPSPAFPPMAPKTAPTPAPAAVPVSARCWVGVISAQAASGTARAASSSKFIMVFPRAIDQRDCGQG